MLMLLLGIKKSKDEIKNHDKTYLTKEGQKKKELTQTQQEKVRAKISKSEYALEQKPKLKKKKLNLMDYHETGNDSLLS